MPQLEIRELVSGYGKALILHRVSMSVDRHELVAVFGPNGAGKTTLVRTIMGEIATRSGAIEFEGIRTDQLATEQLARRGLACVPQEGNTFPALTVAENLAVGLGSRAQRDTSDALDRIFHLFPVLKERRHQRAATLSGGERQMLAVGSAMASNPKLLILDEPTSGLAPILVDKLIEAMLSVAQSGTTTLWIVGDSPEKILRHAHRSYLMQSGMVTNCWSAGELPLGAQLGELYFGETAAA